MNLGNVMLNEISQVQKDMYHMISHTCGTYKCPIKSKTGLCSISATARRLLGGPGPRTGDIAAAAGARSYSKDSEGSWFRSLFVHKVDPRKDAHSTLLSKKDTSNLYKIRFHNVKPECLDAYNSLTEAVLPQLHLDEDYPCSLVGNWNTW
jgi:hypothetical protein